MIQVRPGIAGFVLSSGRVVGEYRHAVIARSAHTCTMILGD
jgi:hypothetical protein